MSMWDVWLCAAMLVSMAWCGAFDSPELAWLIVQESQASSSGQPVRRITPKSVFLAPSFTSCAEGYKEDAMGRCVKGVKVNHSAQLEFLLKRLNAMYGVPEPTQKKTSTGPLRLSIPLATEEAPTTTTTSPLDLTTQISTTNFNPSASTIYPTVKRPPCIPSLANPCFMSTMTYPQSSYYPTDSSTRYYPTGTTYFNVDPPSTTPQDSEESTEVPFVIVVPNTTQSESSEWTETSTITPTSTAQTSTLESTISTTESTTFPTSTMPTTLVGSIGTESEITSIPEMSSKLKRTKCSIPAQVSRMEDGQELPSIECEESEQQPVVAKRPSIRFPSDTQRRPAGSSNGFRFPPEVNKVWENRPYWWPQSWNREPTPVRQWSHSVPSSYQKIQHFPHSTWYSGNPVWARGL